MEAGGTHYRSLGLDAIFQYTGSGVQLFSGMIFYVIIARLFNTSSVGAIALFVAIIGLFSIIFTFGLTTAAQHFISYNLGKGNFASVRHTIYKIISFGIIFSSVGFACIQLFAGEIAIIFLHSSSYVELVRILGVVLFGYVMFGILNGVLLGVQNFRLSAMINIVIWITYYFGAVLLAYYLRNIDMIILGWGLGIFIGVIVEFAAVMTSIRKYLGRGKAPTNAFLFSYSIPVLLSSLISYGAASADRFVVSGLLNLSYLGVYNFALLVASSMGILLVPFNNILMPKFSQMFGDGRKSEISPTVMVSLTLLSSIFVPAALGIAALSPIILDLLAGHVYVQGAMALRIIMITGAFFVGQTILAQALASVRKTKFLLYSSSIALTSNVIASILLIPRLGLIGAAIGFSSVYAVIFTSLLFFAKREKIVSIDLSAQVKIWFSAMIMFVIVDIAIDLFGLRRIDLVPYILLGGFVYLASARILKIFRKENKELVLSLFPPNFTRVKKLISFLILH